MHRSSFRFWKIQFPDGRTRLEMSNPPYWNKHALLPAWIGTYGLTITASSGYSVEDYYELCEENDFGKGV